MKYSINNPPLVCMQTQSTCYKETNKMNIKGILWHSTGANNTTIKRYVQPSENDVNYTKLMALIGTNQYKNDWNHTNIQAGLNAWIGTLADGSVATVQTMPWNYKPWGCGSGSKGSCNNGWIQFEICEDELTNKTYFDKIYKEACELTAYLCKLYNLNPKGTVPFGGTNVPVILCHQDSYKLGLGTNHEDVYHWFNRYGKTMDNVRQDVATLLSEKTAEEVIITTPTISPQKVLARKGEISGRIRELQQNLIKLGYSCGSQEADGDFGNDTETAVIKFQQDHKLRVNGIVGQETQEAIQNALKKLKTPIPQTNVIYRVRKTWNDVSSQKGAYRLFENAKKICDVLGPDYKVFDNNGNIVYSIDKARIPTSPISPPTNEVVKPKPRRSYATVMIGSSSKDERGQCHGGQIGDQTEKEVCVLNWYYQNWNVVLRPTDEVLAEKIACAMEDACDNNNIGYNQLERNSLYIEAKKVELDISKISTPCGCDCSSLVSVCCICAGLPASYFYHGNICTTYTLRNACLSTGKFSALTDKKYLTQKDYLKRGDILLNETQHVVVVLADGQKVENSTIKPTEVDINNNNTLNTSYSVKITAKTLNVRSQPNTDAPITTTITKGGIYTIVDERGGWGRLKSGIGWINLQYTQKV